jgi:hypothetical protein
LLINGIIYTIFIFYFDNVLESNRGKAKSPIFFIYKIGRIFGLCKPKTRKLGENDDKKYFQDLNKSIREASLAGFNNTLEQDINQMIDNRVSSIQTNSVNLDKQEKLKISKSKGYQTVIDEYEKIKKSRRK